jgi:hypothetical protein
VEDVAQRRQDLLTILWDELGGTFLTFLCQFATKHDFIVAIPLAQSFAPAIRPACSYPEERERCFRSARAAKRGAQVANAQLRALDQPIRTGE